VRAIWIVPIAAGIAGLAALTTVLISTLRRLPPLAAAARDLRQRGAEAAVLRDRSERLGVDLVEVRARLQAVRERFDRSDHRNPEPENVSLPGRG